jgi:hypothetical protein
MVFAQDFFVVFAGRAYQDQAVAGLVSAILKIAGFALAVDAFADVFGVLGELMGHTVVKDIQIAFPQTLIAIFLAVFDYAAVHLINLFEAAVLHKYR